MVNALTTLKSAAVAQLFSSDPDSKQQNISRILPHNVNTKPQPPTAVAVTQSDPQSSVIDLISSEDTDATPRPKDRINVSSTKPLTTATTTTMTAGAYQRRFDPESDPTRAKQYAALASKKLTKQTSTFVEKLANATALKSASATVDISLRSSGSPVGPEHEKHEVTFKSHTLENDGVNQNTEAEIDDLGSLVGSKGMEDAFKGLENLGKDEYLTLCFPYYNEFFFSFGLNC
jgi:hypothetical protein